MKADIYIHIGVHKTGTSSIQAALYGNRRKLQRHDINYLGIDENHSTTLFPLFCDAPEKYWINRRAGIDTAAKAARKNAATARALRRALDGNRCSRFVISGEALSVLSTAGVVRLQQTLSRYATRIRVIVYLREPYSYITSAFQQRLRQGETYEGLIAKGPLPNYRARLSSYIEVFGREALDIRVFDQDRFVDGNLIADFLCAIGAPPAIAKELPVRHLNTALSLEAAWLLNEVNKRYPVVLGERPDPARAAGLLRLLAEIPGQKFTLPSQVYAAAAPAVERDLRWLRDLLGEDPFERPAPAGPSAPQWNEETIAALAHLINELAVCATWRRRWNDAKAFAADLARRTPRLFGRNGDNVSQADGR